jgi:hypothetical protein
MEAPELVTPRRLCRDDGRLDAAALGWSRRPLHQCNLSGHFGRKKRWDWWGILDRRLFVALVVADLDYLGLAGVSALELAGGRRFDRFVVRPLGVGCRLGDAVAAPLELRALGLRLSVTSTDDEVRLHARARTLGQSLALDVTARRGRDSLNVVVPWDEHHFQFTSKHVGLRASGGVEWNGTALALDDGAFVTHDFGRGIWPRRSAWSWAAGAAGELAFNLGGGWTDGTGATENGLFVAGELRKIVDEVRFTDEGRRLRSLASDAVDLRFEPTVTRRAALPAPLLSARLDWRGGHFSGRILDQRLDAVPGWSESFAATW